MESWLIAIGILGGLLALLWFTRSGRRPERRLTDAEREASIRATGHQSGNPTQWGS